MLGTMVELLGAEREEAFWAGVENARKFFMGEADVQRALERLSRILDERGIPYAVIGALALNEWGYRRVTVGVDVLLTPEGLWVLELIRVLSLPLEKEASLDASLREKYRELWQAAQTAERE